MPGARPATIGVESARGARFQAIGSRSSRAPRPAIARGRRELVARERRPGGDHQRVGLAAPVVRRGVLEHQGDLQHDAGIVAVASAARQHARAGGHDERLALVSVDHAHPALVARATANAGRTGGRAAAAKSSPAAPRCSAARTCRTRLPCPLISATFGSSAGTIGSSRRPRRANRARARSKTDPAGGRRRWLPRTSRPSIAQNPSDLLAGHVGHVASRTTRESPWTWRL